ncbi:RES family NAD+ phosphorylase [Azospirillum brasilense]|uniref:RES family NAD+ phosphorylase n=1 Tax=Azospirillum brasilense TaxID=192 RepID=UPI001FFEE84A|nr:RES family NAD+ phosphorylase [Azospirillum brasilense]
MTGECWRLVEAQNKVSTLKLVDSLDEQDLLERLIEGTKPPVPNECRGLHFLLSTPFRYDAPYPAGSRFRRAGMTPGVYYAAESVHTAVAELSFYRLLFFAESPDTPWPANPNEHTAFCAAYGTDQGLDLTAPPLDRDTATWAHPTHYEPCQTLAETARQAGIQAIRYASVRDPDKGVCLALLTCAAFREPKPTTFQTWRIYLRGSGIQALCEFPDIRLEFNRSTFIGDARIAAMRWDR